MTSSANRRLARTDVGCSRVILGAVLAADSRAAGNPDPIFDAIAALSQAWARYFYSDVTEKWEERSRRTPEIDAAHDDLAQAVDEAMAKLCETPPRTLAGARAVLEYITEWDRDCLPENSGRYLPTLLRSPIFASGSIAPDADRTRAEDEEAA